MRRAVVALVLSFVAACLPMEGPRFYPEWKRVDQGESQIGSCATLDGWISKTGKEGMGIVLFLRGSAPQPCIVPITKVELRIDGAVHHAKRLPPTPTLRDGQQVFAWVPIFFDGNEAWNDSDAHEATLVIEGPTGSVPIVWNLSYELRDRFPCSDENEKRPR